MKLVTVPRLGVVALLLLIAIPAFPSLVSPPQVTVAFAPDYIQPNQPSTLTLTLSNSNDSPLTGATMVDHIDPHITLLAPATTNCPSSSVSFAGGTLNFSGQVAANSTCTITALVTAVTPGAYQNSPGALFSIGPPSNPREFAYLNVFIAVPAMSKAGLLALALAAGAIGAGVLVKRG